MLITQLDDMALRQVRTACSTLFSEELASDDKFLENLNVESVEKAYWQAAKKCYLHLHPLSSREQALEILIGVRQSYETLHSYLQGNVQSPEDIIRKGKIIAIGGAKGGIG